jgi:uncharacterized protein
MAVIAEVTLRGVSPEQYDAVRERTGWLTQLPDGGLAHLTWWEGADCHNVDGWESEAAFGAFGEQRLAPAMAAVGVDVQPEVTFHPAHEIFTPRRGVIAETPTPNVAGDNVGLIRTGYRHFAAGDIPSVLALFDPSIDWYTPDSVAYGGRFSGPEAVGAFFATLSQYYSEFSVEPQTFQEAGDAVIVQGSFRARTLAGNRMDEPWVHVWTFRDGKATSFTEFFDTAKMNAALGGGAQTTAAQPLSAGASA